MPSTASLIDIYNMALDLLQETPVAIGDGKPATNWLDRNYGPSRDAELRAAPWNFALRRTELAADVATPAFDWTYQYTAPTNWLAIRDLTQGGKLNEAPILYEMEGDKILTNSPPPLKVRYVIRVTTEGEYDPLFVQVLRTRLAMEMSHWMTGKQSFTERLTQMYRDAVLIARTANAIETTVANVYSDDVIAARI